MSASLSTSPISTARSTSSQRQWIKASATGTTLPRPPTQRCTTPTRSRASTTTAHPPPPATTTPPPPRSQAPAGRAGTDERRSPDAAATSGSTCPSSTVGKLPTTRRSAIRTAAGSPPSTTTPRPLTQLSHAPTASPSPQSPSPLASPPYTGTRRSSTTHKSYSQNGAVLPGHWEDFDEREGDKESPDDSLIFSGQHENPTHLPAAASLYLTTHTPIPTATHQIQNPTHKTQPTHWEKLGSGLRRVVEGVGKNVWNEQKYPPPNQPNQPNQPDPIQRPCFMPQEGR
ncbi:hypothetical protein BDZ91DRAFT_741244 [Kalaharituber pfeilii]|nr:hypothetical protein BDZ91DRAFT_741244 [Kalaharituber pfeilii]